MHHNKKVNFPTVFTMSKVAKKIESGITINLAFLNKLLFVITLVLFCSILNAQTSEQYSIKIEGIHGNILACDTHIKELIKKPVTGGELSIEFQTMGEKSWHQFNAFPIVGVAAVYLNLGNPHKLGNAFALYPYINYPLLRTSHLKLNLKAGVGMSYLTKTYYSTNKDSVGNTLAGLSGTNGAIGSAINVYFSGGGNIEIPISKGLSLMAEYTWNHMSNGSVVTPNSGLNLLNTFIGLKYCPNYKNTHTPAKQYVEYIPRKFSLEFIAAGGVRQLYYKDNKSYPIASLSLALYRPLSNFYRMGIGVDGFYDGVYNGKTQLERTYITSDELKNKIRIGASWQHEILFGHLTAGFGFGLYLYDPLKNLSPYNRAKKEAVHKPLIYKYNIEDEDGWFYSRAVLKYSLSQHYFLSVALKNHLKKAEFIEWGIGYKF